MLKVFVDGSHLKASDNRGYGILCVDNNGNEYGLSRHPVTPELMESKFLVETKYFKQLSNPTMEFAAVVEALHIVDNCDCKEIEIYYDYIGSVNWLTGKWRAKKPYIRSICSVGKRYLMQIEGSKKTIKWQHIKSHSGHRENDIADQLARGVRLPKLLPMEKIYNNYEIQHFVP
jgi:ribonuclease HI